MTTICRHIVVCALSSFLAASLISGCRKGPDEDGFWPQPFDMAADEATTPGVSSIPCPFEIDEYIDQLRCAELQADAAAIDMILQLVFMPNLVDGAKMSRECADETRDMILAIRCETEPVPTPPECGAVRTAFLEALNQAAGFYDGIDRKSHARMRRELAKSREAIHRYRALAAALQPLPVVEMPDPVPPKAQEYIDRLTEEHNEPTDTPPEALANYIRLEEAGVGDDDPEMAAAIDAMQPGKPPLPWDAWPMDLPDDDDVEGSDESGNLNALRWILAGGQYHPFMYDAFVCWRGETQYYFHGMSNFSEIPNAEYNKVRFAAVETIQAHLRQHPNDNWARIQKALLLATPNIQRGGLFGNTAMFEYAAAKGWMDEIDAIMAPDDTDP